MQPSTKTQGGQRENKKVNPCACRPPFEIASRPPQKRELSDFSAKQLIRPNSDKGDKDKQENDKQRRLQVGSFVPGQFFINTVIARPGSQSRYDALFFEQEGYVMRPLRSGKKQRLHGIPQARFLKAS